MVACIGFPASARAGDKLILYAASSLTDVVQELSKSYGEKSGITVFPSFASSSTLAKQIAAGAPAGIFISANTEWMDFLEKKGLIKPDSRKNLLTNSLVMIAPKGKGFSITLTKDADFPQTFKGKLAIGDPDHVPAGQYGKEALVSLGWWDALSGRVAAAMDVRFALAFVEQGEAEVGIVYKTDALASQKVEVVATFPPETHSPILYPIGLTQGATQEAEALYRFLVSGEAGAIYTKYGFSVPEK